MLKEMIRQLASSAENMKMVMGGQVQLAGVSMEEQRALLGELKEKDSQTSYYGYGWN
ncbi:competence pheromone ComX [Paenibacillus sp. LHD-117]|uniref:competence pheromone ComX n=1 Tax=Paenibacillus sp. LHD-117 TaxID=3071412 RepID=UPI0027E1C082|nr:competence pheromone ComX [Paenibacillus sp. LHD-117]MDQ6420098.1 competence pheromone ComX [Paenibacillus sp. LHD-117]